MLGRERNSGVLWGGKNAKYWEGIYWDIKFGILRIIRIFTLGTWRDCLYITFMLFTVNFASPSNRVLERYLTCVNFLSRGWLNLGVNLCYCKILNIQIPNIHMCWLCMPWKLDIPKFTTNILLLSVFFKFCVIQFLKVKYFLLKIIRLFFSFFPCYPCFSPPCFFPRFKIPRNFTRLVTRTSNLNIFLVFSDRTSWSSG
jgi:hypothetical protein